MWLTNSSLGRKVVMSVTGLFLLLFVTFHVLMNAVALISPRGYNLVCEFLGANWYALIATVILAAGFVFHIIYAFSGVSPGIAVASPFGAFVNTKLPYIFVFNFHVCPCFKCPL